ncbi:MAG: hydantoinase/oxoprolinase family protein [Pseudomonadota bacterium]
MTWLAGVDVGGTFTDVVLVNTKSGEVRVKKVPTTDNQAEGFLAGLKATAPLQEIQAVVHGTTVGTNAILERKGARTGLITTKGFRDVLELGRRTRPNPYGMTGQFQPLVPRDLRAEIPERVDASGATMTPLDGPAVEAAARELMRAGVESLAVMFMHSYANHAHELEARRIIERVWNNRYVSLSHEVLPEVGEFERTSTTVINAYLQPLLDRYLARVEDELKRAGYRRPFRIMQSNGGALNVSNAVRGACRSVLSGPAGGVIAASWIGRRLGAKNVISADMGGTSFDVGLVLDGEPLLAEEKEFAYGVPSRIPMIDIETIGAGGGSIVRVDEAGLVEVGPQSAGAHPGPICYGAGGTMPTVTDANVIMGRLDIERVVPGRPHDLAKATAAFAEIGRKLGLSAEDAAAAAIRVVNVNMAGAIKRVSLEKGMDPRKFALVPFGGAGPLHACEIADELHIPQVVVPAWPGVTSALGCLLADIKYDDTWTLHRRVEQVTKDQVRDLYDKMVKRIVAVIEEDGVARGAIAWVYEAALQYEGQTHRVIVTLPSPDTDARELFRRFEEEYRRRYGVTVEGIPVRLVNLRVRASARRHAGVDIKVPLVTEGSAARARTGMGRMMFGGTWVEAEIDERWKLPTGTAIPGPARIDQADTTTLVPPHWVARIDPIGNIEIRRKGA